MAAHHRRKLHNRTIRPIGAAPAVKMKREACEDHGPCPAVCRKEALILLCEVLTGAGIHADRENQLSGQLKIHFRQTGCFAMLRHRATGLDHRGEMAPGESGCCDPKDGRSCGNEKRQETETEGSRRIPLFFSGEKCQ